MKAVHVATAPGLELVEFCLASRRRTRRCWLSARVRLRAACRHRLRIGVVSGVFLLSRLLCSFFCLRARAAVWLPLCSKTGQNAVVKRGVHADGEKKEGVY